MAGCCDDKSCAIEALKQRQATTLKIVLAINAIMFVIMLGAGLLASSTALMSDSLDNLGDAVTYGLSLYVVSRGARDKALVALFKGGLILAAGLFVIGLVIYHLLVPSTPMFEAMAGVGLLAFAANGICLALLSKHRHEDINMSSVWECSRNDIAANLAVIVAGGGVWLTQSAWPDLLVGLILSLFLINSSRKVLWGAWDELQSQSAAQPS